VDESGDNAIVLMGGANHSYNADDVDRIFSDNRVTENTVLLLQNEINNLESIIRAGKSKGFHVFLVTFLFVFVDYLFIYLFFMPLLVSTTKIIK
jgi:hypothetical protein